MPKQYEGCLFIFLFLSLQMVVGNRKGQYHVKTIEMDVTNNTTRFCPIELIWYQESKIINFI
jgi:hypothetical protein